MERLPIKPHTGLVVAQNIQDRDTVAQNPTRSKNQQDSKNLESLIPDKQKDIKLEQEIKVRSLNVEGLSMPKCEFLSRLLKKHDGVALHLQETHLRKDEAPTRYEIPKYTLVANLNHEQYGIASKNEPQYQ